MPVSPPRNSDGTHRAVRNRSRRPCDACRKGKARCTVPESGPPCTHCGELGRTCTFDEPPPTRRPHQSSPSDANRQDGLRAGSISGNGTGTLRRLSSSETRSVRPRLEDVVQAHEPNSFGVRSSQETYDHLAANNVTAWCEHFQALNPEQPVETNLSPYPCLEGCCRKRLH